jgi:hypothetical protein
MKALAGLLVILALAALASAAVRGVRRAAWPHDVDEAGRGVARALVEGLIVLAVVILVVVVVVAFVT